MDIAGNTAMQSITIKVDKTPPIITAFVAPSANAAGWNNTNVDVVFTCADSDTGLASCPLEETASPEGTHRSFSGVAPSLARNNGFAQLQQLIDKALPFSNAISPETMNSTTLYDDLWASAGCTDGRHRLMRFSASYTYSHALDYDQLGLGIFPEGGHRVISHMAWGVAAAFSQTTASIEGAAGFNSDGRRRAINKDASNQINTNHLTVRVLENGGAHLSSISTISVIETEGDLPPIQDADRDTVGPQMGVKVLDSGGASLIVTTAKTQIHPVK
jgi:hypothetical protein